MAKVSDYTLVIPKNASFNEKRAASFIRQYIRLITGKTVPLVTDETTPVQWEIAIGKTNREQLDEMDFSRDREKVWEYLLQSRGGRLYITGLGLPPQEQPPYNTAYRLMDDGAIGTVFGAYHFVEKILGFDFVYDTYDVYPEKPNVQIPGGYSYRLTAEKLEKQLPKKIEGTAMYSIPGCKILNWNMSCFLFRTRQGKLVVIEGGQAVPFDIKRVFYIYGTEGGVVRGQHANRESEFVLINVAGTSKVRITDGTESFVVELDKPMMGVYIPQMIWKDMYDFSEDSVLLVLASTHYDGKEYVRNFEEYVALMRDMK